MDEIGSIYAEGRTRLTELVLSEDPEGLTAPVPGCPEWAVRDVIAHVSGVCADVLAGNMEGVTTEPWTAAQVLQRKDKTLPEILDEWAEVAPQVEAIAPHFPSRVDEQWVLDLTTHEHDIRGALSSPGGRDAAGVVVGVDFAATVGLAASIKGRGLPALRVKAGDAEWVVGDGDPAASVEGSPFELFRAMTGRRSERQVRGLQWDGDADLFIPAFEFGPFTFAKDDLVE
ncbi:MAG: maleylpyruvate isomerase family mycothiol-dependent enzyme [Acidimicrobiia bacterium]|nr:maleylpyruvate isomerase family mycothiol-dependent enzyme [Acidimicrobiia bacterium]